MAEALQVTSRGLHERSWYEAVAARPDLELIGEWPSVGTGRTVCLYGIPGANGILAFWDRTSYITAAEVWFMAEMHGTLVPLDEVEAHRLQVVRTLTQEHSMQVQVHVSEAG